MKNKELNWEEELSELAEKYCKHDDRELNSCLYWIFRPVIIKALKAKDKEFIEILDGLDKELEEMIAKWHYRAGKDVGYYYAITEIIKRIKQIKQKYEY